MCARCQAQNRQARRFQPGRAPMNPPVQPPRNPDITFEPLGANAPVPVPAQVDTLAADLAAFAQDERNGAAFYQYLADMASSEWDRDLLLELSENSFARSESAAALVREGGGSCETNKYTVTENIRYGDGVTMAVRQESRTIESLAVLLERAEESRQMRGVQALLARKMGDYGKLQLLR